MYQPEYKQSSIESKNSPDIQYKHIAVIGTNIRQAKRKLKDMLEDMRYGDIEQIIENPSQLKIILKNNTIYFTVVSGYASRGYRFDMAYVHRSVSTEDINEIIRPYLRDWKGADQEPIIYYS